MITNKETTEISYFRGDSHPLEFTFSNQETNEPLNLSGSTFIMTVDRRQNPTDATTVLFQVVGEIIGLPSEGVVSFKPTPDQTSSAGNFFYDIQMTGDDGSIRTLVKDKIIISMDITKDTV